MRHLLKSHSRSLVNCTCVRACVLVRVRACVGDGFISGQIACVDGTILYFSFVSDPQDDETFLRHLESCVEVFVNRMKSDSARGRSIAIDSSVQSLFMSLSHMHPKLLQIIQKMEEKRAHYEALQVT